MKLIISKKLSVLTQSIFLIATLVFSGLTQAEAPLDIATTPLSNSSPTQVKPNMLYVLDDSGSMGWEFMPDWTWDGAGAHPGVSFHTDASYNALAYNPGVRYLPPVYYTNTGAPNTTSYPSQTGMATATGANWQTKPNWKNVRRDAYNSGLGTNNLETGGPNYKGVELSNPQYTVSVANEYCTRTDLRECVSSSIPTVTHPYAARIRWCNNAGVATNIALPADNACQSVRTGAFVNMRVPLSTVSLPTQATITINWAWWKPRIDGITINGQQIMRNNPNPNTNNTNTLANRIRNKINACTTSAVGNCTVSGYSASRSGNVVTIYAPSAVSGTPIVQYSSGGINYTPTGFSAPGGVPANNRVTVNILPANNSYAFPGTTVKHSARADCVGVTCTYNEEMINYANWYTYYRNRMQMMKTSTSLAFEDVGDDFRMGFMTINTNASEALDFRIFSGANKAAWYNELFSTIPGGGTPLRDALSRAGRIYADKYSLSGVFNDPIQYECQSNYTLLTTDGKWNSAAGYKLDGSGMTDQDNDSSEKGKFQGSNQSSHTLADVAKYYRDTDLRDGSLGNCSGALGTNVCSTTGTTPLLNRKQTMVTLTLGLGVDGTLAYDTEYGPNVAGDFKQVYDGTKQWPQIISNGETTIDDLWHAAVNGDGRYFSAKKTADLISQLREAIALIKVSTGAGSAAATSTLNPVSGDNFAYVASYTTGHWKGNLEKRTIDLTDGSVSKNASACVEDVVPEDNCSAPSIIEPNGLGGYECVTTGVTDSALCTTPLAGSECREPIVPDCEGTLKDQIVAGSRNIYMNNGGTRANFDFTQLSVNESINFSSSFLQANLTQGSSYTSGQLANLTGANLVDYLKGNATYELDSAIDDNKLYRKRTAVLGDLISSKPSFIGKPTFNYGDSGYQAFKAANASRAGRVYVGSNDGMLHAFDATTLQEKWTFVPTAVIPNLWKLADSNYSANHQYYVNGDVAISDICVAADCTTATASDWRTILIAGFDGGARGYYALDITDPDSPNVLWEIDPSDAGFNNLGYSYGNPIITKRNGDGKWVVLFTSGYNNIPDNNGFYASAASTNFKPTITPQLQFNSGDGQGYLYVVEAKSGNRLATIPTGSGSSSSPSGLAKISAYASNGEVNNLAQYVYGGDLDGNVWRFNIDATTNSVLHFAQLKDSFGNAQPVMTPPELGLVGNKKVIFVGTGKYLEVTDLDASGFSTQSLYALKDIANDGDPEPVYNNARSVVGIVAQTIVPSADPSKSDERVSGSNSGVDLSTDIGWYIDYPDNGERQNVASQLVLGTLLVPTTVPTASACQPSGYGWFNYLDYKTGLSVIAPFGSVSQRTSSPSVGFNVVYIGGKPAVSNVVADDPNPAIIDGLAFGGGDGKFQLRRSIWREIVE
ncbi:MAG: PilC/PilY family type IV pilus protein [Methylophilaceae bacterium]